ncbi:MAG: hypothetical protein WEE66_14140 [Actinomycetota bacterium]
MIRSSCGKLIALTIVAAALLPPGAVANAAFPGGNGDIAFGRSSKGQVDIWVVYAGVTGTRRLTDTPNRIESMPDWNAAGTRIAYVRCSSDELGNCDIFARDADGSNPTRLTSTPGVQETWPAWSPNGSAIAYTSNAQDSLQDIWVMDANGSNPVRLTSGPRVDERPDWAPDGTRIVFSRNGHIWAMDDDGQNEMQLTDTKQDEFAPVFSPNGRRIGFSRLGNDHRIGVWVMRDDGSVRVQKTFGRIDFFPDWQPI